MIDFNKGKEIFNKFRGSEVKTSYWLLLIALTHTPQHTP